MRIEFGRAVGPIYTSLQTVQSLMIGQPRPAIGCRDFASRLASANSYLGAVWKLQSQPALSSVTR